MKTLPGIIAIGCLLAISSATADEQTAAAAKGSVKQAPNAELQLLQGKWEGIAVNDKTPEQKQIGADIDFLKPGVAESPAEPQEIVTITITGNSFHFHRDKDFWFKTTISLPEGKEPRQFHATINDSPSKSSIGEVVGAIFKIEEGTLTIVASGSVEEMPKSFEAPEIKGLSRYQLRKVQTKDAEMPPDK